MISIQNQHPSLPQKTYSLNKKILRNRVAKPISTFLFSKKPKDPLNLDRPGPFNHQKNSGGGTNKYNCIANRALAIRTCVLYLGYHIHNSYVSTFYPLLSFSPPYNPNPSISKKPASHYFRSIATRFISLYPSGPPPGAR